MDEEHSDESEERYNVIGCVERILFVVYTERGENNIRIISARRATPKEEKLYYEDKQEYYKTDNLNFIASLRRCFFVATTHLEKSYTLSLVMSQTIQLKSHFKSLMKQYKFKISVIKIVRLSGAGVICFAENMRQLQIY